MSKYQDCAVFVDKNGRYCCNNKTMDIGEGCACGFTIALANVPAVDLQIKVADEWVTHSTLSEVTTTLIEAGTYRIDPAFCEALEGTDAPEEGAMSICCDELDCAALDYIAICEKLENLSVMLEGDAMVTVDFAPVVDKLCEVLDATVAGDVIATDSLAKLCEILEAITENNSEEQLAKLCDVADLLTAMLAADAVAHTAELACLVDIKAAAADQLACLEELKVAAAAELECLEEIKANTATAEADAAAELACLEQIKANTAAITGIETALGQVGCIVDAEGNQTGTVLVCKVSDTSTTPPTDTIKVWAFNSDGSVVEDYTGPYEPCTNLSALLDCLDQIKEKTYTKVILWGVREDTNTVDNHSVGEPRPAGPGIVAWPTDNHEVSVTLSDGTTCVMPWPGVAADADRWLNSNTNLAAALAGCGKAFAFAVAGPDSDTATAWGGHAAATCCPGDTYVVAATATVVDGKRAGRQIPLATSYQVGETAKFLQHICPGEPVVWTDLEGNVVEAPDLTCAEVDCQFPAGPNCCPPEPNCSLKTYGPLSDCLFSADPDEDPETLATDIYVDVETCDGVSTTVIYTLDAEGLPEEYELQGELANEDKTLFLAEPECPDVDWTAIQIKRKLNILDNSLWADAPAVHIGVGDSPSFEIDVTFEDGVRRFSWPGGKGMFNAFYAWLAVESPDCVTARVCANWDRCPYGMPWDLEVPRECLFARGWSVYCCEGTPCMVRADIVESSDPAWVGASKEAWTFAGPVETVYEGHVGCDRVHKDCEGNMIELPANCCPYLGDGCDSFCPPRVAYDLVCFGEEQKANDTLIGAFEPIIRQQVTPQAQIDCECVDAGPTESRFFNFLEPETEFTDPIEFDGPCDPQTQVTKERCDAKGQVVTVVEISTTISGSSSATTFYDDNGEVVTPAFPLSVCNPRVQIICGCIRDINGNIVVRNVQQHNSFDELGTSDATYFSQGKAVLLGRGWYFDCDCEDRKVDTVGGEKYTYDLAGFTFPCTESTLEVDGVEVDLCGGESGPSVIPSMGDICTVGGVRSDFDGDRCYTDPQSDPAGYAAELLNHGSFGDKTVNALAQQATANFGMAVRGTFPSLEGTTAASLDFSAMWNTGSGIAIAAYDCATGNDLDVIGGTPSTFDAVGGPGCQVPSSRGPTDVWGYTGMHTVTFDTSAVADLSTVVFYSIVLNPGVAEANADYLSGVTVQGVAPGGIPCEIQSATDFAPAIQSLLPDCLVEFIPESRLCITCDGIELGPLTCDDVSSEPVVTDLSVEINPPYVALAPCSVSALAGDDSAVTELLNEIAELQGENLVKNCFIDEALSNPNCPASLAQTLDKEAQVLNLEGDVVSQYPAGTTISLQDGNGNICGSATVDTVETPAVYDAESDTTTIQIEECELQEGKTAVQVKEAKAVKQQTAQAVKAVVKQVSIRTVKAEAKLVKKVRVKTETDTKTETKAERT